MKGKLVKLRALCTPQMLVVMLMGALMLVGFSGGSGSTQGMTELEARISQTLSEIEGAEKVRVVIRTRAQAVSGGVLGTLGRGEEIPCGALAVAQGADDPVVRMKLTHALCALLGLQASEVEVISLNKGAKP